MKYIILSGLLLVNVSLLAQSSYWQQHLQYTIEVELNDVEKSLTGRETIRYKNNSPDTLNFIWFHIWANAYKNDSTALLKQIRRDSTRQEKEKSLGYGSLDGLSFTVNNTPAQTEPHPNPNYIDVIKVLLPQPLLPGDSTTISTPFKVKLPPYFSRSGFSEGEFMICQWYPKPAVYDKSGWHEFPYLDMGEFYSEYGDFNVSITLPSAYVVGATGSLLTKEELQAYKTTGAKNVANRNKVVKYAPAKQPKKTLRYSATQVPDFAWFADKGFVIQYDTVKLRSGKVIDAFSYYHDKKKTLWNNSIDYVKDAVKKYSYWIGEYEYPTVQAVEGPSNNSSGGMEYPMITLITSPDANPESLDAVIAHEVGHNWFMSMIGSNERDHTWMDEGLNTYFQFRYEAEKYRSNSIFGNAIPEQLKALPADQFLDKIYMVIGSQIPMQSAMDIPADQFPNSMEYGIVSYIKTALWMYIFESAVGREKAALAIQNYFTKWKNKHPQPADMQASFEEAAGIKLDELFQLTKKEGKLE
ncbi:MAG TPA: M1 family metallopeptidase [Ohtaekwangia sp.]